MFLQYLKTVLTPSVWPFYSSCEEGVIELRYFVRSKVRNGSLFFCDKGEWRAVCDDNWDLHDAKVVCRQMGFSGKLEHNLH